MCRAFTSTQLTYLACHSTKENLEAATESVERRDKWVTHVMAQHGMCVRARGVCVWRVCVRTCVRVACVCVNVCACVRACDGYSSSNLGTPLSGVLEKDFRVQKTTSCLEGRYTVQHDITADFRDM